MKKPQPRKMDQRRISADRRKIAERRVQILVAATGGDLREWNRFLRKLMQALRRKNMRLHYFLEKQ